MTSAAEAALARAADAERDAAAEVVSLRKEASALAARVEAARVEEERRRERIDVDALVADVDAAEKEVLRKAERNAETMETLRASVDALAARLAEKAAEDSPSSRKPRKVSNDLRSPRRRCSRIARRRRAWTRLEFRRCRSDRSPCPRGRRPVDTRRGFPKSRRARTASRGSNPRLLGFETRYAHPPSPRRRWRRARRRIARARGRARTRSGRSRRNGIRLRDGGCGVDVCVATRGRVRLGTTSERRRKRKGEGGGEGGARVARDGARGGALATRGLAGSTGGARGE